MKDKKHIFVRLNKRSISKIIKLIIPMMILVMYTELLTPNQYTSNTKILIKSMAKPDNLSGLGSLMMPTQNTTDAMLMKEYVESNSMYEIINSKYNLESVYMSDEEPIHSRIFENKKENLYERFNEKVDVSVDEISGVITISYESGNKDRSRMVLIDIVKASEDFVESINKTLVNLEVREAKEALEESIIELSTQTRRMISYQKKKEMISPEDKVGRLRSTLLDLKSKKIDLQLELKKKRNYLQPESFEVTELSESIKSIQGVIDEVASSISNSNKDSSLPRTIGGYEEISADLELAKKMWEMAAKNLNVLKKSSVKKSKVIITISKPTIPQVYSYPDRWSIYINALIIMLLVFGIFGIVKETIRDHKD